jgi:hypothetical protein
MDKIRLLVVSAVAVACVAAAAPSSAFANYASSHRFSCARGGYEWGDCRISVGTYYRLVEGTSLGAGEIWLDSTHAIHTAGGRGTVDYRPRRNNPNWKWRACGWFYHVQGAPHIVCSPWVYEGRWG